jgi:hypothetical protein
MRTLACTFATALVLTLFCAVAAAETQEDRARARAVQLAKAFEELDAETIVKLTLPDLVSSVGGDAKMRQIMAQKFADGRKAGMVVDSVTLGKQTPTGDDGSTRFIFFPYTVQAHTEKMKFTDRAFYLAISDDAGKTWYFVDGVQLTEAAIRQAFIRGYDGKPPLPKRERHVESR